MIDTERMRDAVKDKNWQYMKNVWMDGSTHWNGCEYSHYPCAVIAMCDEIDRLTAEVERLKAENVHWQEAIGRDSELIEELHLKLESSDMLTDGFGNYYKATCSKCGAPMQVVRPGDIRCSEECYIKDEEAEG